MLARRIPPWRAAARLDALCQHISGMACAEAFAAEDLIVKSFPLNPIAM